MRRLGSVNTEKEVLKILLDTRESEFITREELNELERIFGSLEKAMEFPIVSELVGRTLADKIVHASPKIDRIDWVIGTQNCADLAFVVAREVSRFFIGYRSAKSGFTVNHWGSIDLTWATEDLQTDHEVLLVGITYPNLAHTLNALDIAYEGKFKVRYVQSVGAVSRVGFPRQFQGVPVISLLY